MTRPRSILVSVLVGLASIIGCKSRAPERGAATAPEPPKTLLAASAGERIAVAEVEGVPIYGDCVVTQSTALGVSREQALEQCIDFELLAQAAQRHGKARDADVLWTGKTEAVRRLLDAEIREPLPGAGSIDRALLEDAYKRHRRRLYRPEIRHVAHVLAEVAKDTAEGSSEDRKARALAGELHAALASRRDLSADEFFTRAQEVAGERRLGPRAKKTGAFQREQFRTYPRDPALHRAFVDATFAVPGPGQVSPPVRTHVGWHIILIEEIEPARNETVDQAADALVLLLRRERYVALVKALQQKATIEVDEQAVERLQAAEDALRLAPGESP